MSDPLDARLEEWQRRIEEANKAREAKVAAILKDAPETKRCPYHHDIVRAVDRLMTEHRGKASYEPCPRCADDERLRSYGVPAVLCRATFKNWIPRTDEEKQHLATVREFTERKRGFLVLTGGVGTGKTHLSVALMRHFKHPLLYKQNTLLLALRATYRGNSTANPIKACQGADLFVLDEVGLTSGGKDELPMLHEILDHRFGEYLPTVLTSNLSLDQLRDCLGERLVDRIRGSAFKVLLFGGESHRSDCRDQYLQTTAQEPWIDSL